MGLIYFSFCAFLSIQVINTLSEFLPEKSLPDCFLFDLSLCTPISDPIYLDYEGLSKIGLFLSLLIMLLDSTENYNADVPM